jgi:hypothetical protein
MHPLHPPVEGVQFLLVVLLLGAADPKRFRLKESLAEKCCQRKSWSTVAAVVRDLRDDIREVRAPPLSVGPC